MTRRRGNGRELGVPNETKEQLSARKEQALRAIQNSIWLKIGGKLDQNQVATLAGYSSSEGSTSLPSEVRQIMRTAANRFGLALEEQYPLKKNKATGRMEPDTSKTPTLILHSPKDQQQSA